MLIQTFDAQSELTIKTSHAIAANIIIIITVIIIQYEKKCRPSFKG